MNEQYNEMFTAFQTNKINVQLFDTYIKQKCGHYYDEHLFQQLIELSMDNEQIDLETFINQYNETVDTLQFRSEIITNKVKELRIVHQQLSDQLGMEALQQNSLTIQIMDCQNIEIKDPSVYLQISCGTKVHKTRNLKGPNPQFSEQFEFPIDQSSSDVVITLFETTTDNMIGYTQFAIQELREQKLKDINVNLQRQDNMKIKTKLHVILKFNLSKESLYKQEQQKLIAEITQQNLELKETQSALMCLSKVFNGGSFKIRQLPPILEIQEFELRYLDTLNAALEDRIVNWIPLFYKLTGCVVALSVMICIYRCQFLDLTVIGYMLALLILKEINQRWMRVFTYIFAVQFLYDFFWLFICGGSYGIIESEKHMNKFVTFLSYIEMVVKVPFTITLWKHSIEFEQFNSYFL